MIKKIIGLSGHVPRSVASAAFLITFLGLVSRLLGLFRDRLLASSFGAGDALDAYYAAFRVPDLIYNLLILGALSSAFIPVFTSLLSRDEEKKAWDLAGGMLNIMLLGVFFFSLLFFILAPWIMKLITPGFSGEEMEQVVNLTRIMFLSPIFLGASGIFGGILTSFRRFLVYSLAPVFYNLGIILGIWVFSGKWGIYGLAWGVVLGAFFHLLIQYFSAKNLGFRPSGGLRENFKNPQIRKVFRLMIPRTLGIAVSQINLFVITIFASFLASGSLAVFSFAQNLQSVPLGIIGISFAIAAFPTLSALAAKEEKSNFVAAFSETFRQILFFVIPLSVFVVLLRAQIVRVVLGTGKFDWEDTILTFECLAVFSLSLFAQCTIPLLARAFYARHNTRIPFYAALISEAVNLGAVLLLLEKFQILSLVIAFSLSSVVQMLILLFVLRYQLEDLEDKRTIKSVGKISLAAVLSGVAMQFSKNLVSQVADLDTFFGVFFQLAAAALLGLAVFSLVAHWIRMEEFSNFKKSLYRRIWGEKKAAIQEDAGEVSGM